MSPISHLSQLEIDLSDEAATLALGAAIARLLQPGVCIHLSGDLGAGKTTLSRGILRGLGFEGRVKSPTYTLVELYVVSKLNLYHFDFYRFSEPEEWNDAGFRDLFNGTNVCLVEWPEKAGELLPLPDLKILLAPSPSTGRSATIQAYTPRGQSLVQLLLQTLPSAVSSK
ncbi:MAG: tRNA (adenosine(37)-N6)-threonylcarbamoyltransferase complex ATPase subunit type 1 TsaE [Betaproteobacteria bacterium]|nr:tRNA (adenosine(37)-N6)-threonylcarbamoyltransferase complex ATPase subunit type 1 TsaE [Betaproteobacteria bacterium]